MLGVISTVFDFYIWEWNLLIAIIGWYVALSQYLHIKNKRNRIAIQKEVACVFEKDEKSFVDYEKSLTLKVKHNSCDVLVAINDNKLMIKLKDKWFIPISRIKGLHRK